MPPNNNNELFPLVNEQGEVIGSATRAFCHGGTKPLHPVVHLHVLSSKGELYLQKRSMLKDIQPGKWDTAVGGHVDYGESVDDALLREAREELGITGFTPHFLQSYVFESEVEKELVYVFTTIYDGMIMTDPNEISEGAFWPVAKIDEAIGKGIFTPNFEQELQRIRRAVFGGGEETTEIKPD